jgi:hypothetical protein
VITAAQSLASWDDDPAPASDLGESTGRTIDDLSPASRRGYAEGLASGMYPDAPSQRMLLRFWLLQDQIADAELQLAATGGAIVRNRFGEMKPNPWTKIRIELVRESARYFRILGLDQEARGADQGKLFG